jgi:histidinol-phosphate/aromatic aminotransferase/cobyric acid decarboxylase-like protein
MEGGADFWSAACIAPPELPPSSLHIMYGLSKDFGLAGARVGVLHTLNANVRSAVASLTHFCEVSR